MYLTASEAKAAGEIDAHIQRCGGNLPGWYVGVASNPRDRLFSDHNVSQNGGAWIFRDAGSESAARDIEDYFHARGCKGGPGGGDGATRYVYAYRITQQTVEAI